jgi:hypothetical protein
MISQTETFDADKLSYIVNNFAEFKPQLRWRERYDIINPVQIMTKYLDRARVNGGKATVRVDYRQRNNKGRFFAMGSMSLQSLPREIRHTIAKDYYLDADMKNAHPVILQWLCRKHELPCPALDAYIADREQYMAQVQQDGQFVGRDKAKQIYLALTNGGKRDYAEISEPSPHMIQYKAEMIVLHREFAEKYPDEFKGFHEAREAENRMFNIEAGFMNTLLCDTENTLLMAMWEYFGKPADAVFCFDGIMLKSGMDYDLKGCEELLMSKFGIDMKLSIKAMDEALDLTGRVMTPYTTTRLEYFEDMVNLIDAGEVYIETALEWVSNSMALIENSSKTIIQVRSLIPRSGDMIAPEYQWTPCAPLEVERAMRVVCKVRNPHYDSRKAFKAEPAEKKEKRKKPTKEEAKLLSKHIWTTLGNTSPRLGEGMLSYLTEYRKMPRYATMDFIPYLKRRGAPHDPTVLNTFTGFALEEADIKYDADEFIKSKLYAHLRDDFFTGNQGEFDHFLDHVADMIQDPATIKGTSHVFYSPQGCGKGLLFQFVSNLLGKRNTVSIEDIDTYFGNSFNVDSAQKILKCFEEVSERGSAFKNHNRLKAEQTREYERIEPKGVNAYSSRNCARYWYFTNNPSPLFIETDDRRHTLHRINGQHANDLVYFKPLWAEVKTPSLLKSAFEFFASRQYEVENTISAYNNTYKAEQKMSNLSHGVSFILERVKQDLIGNNNNYDEVIHLSANEIKTAYQEYCTSNGLAFKYKALRTQILKIGIDKPVQVMIDRQRYSAFKIVPREIRDSVRDMLRMPAWDFDMVSE